MDFCEIHIANRQNIETGNASLVLQFLTAEKKSSFEKIAKGNLSKGLRHIRTKFESDDQLREYVAEISLRVKFPSSWTGQIRIIRDVMEAARSNDPDKLKNFRITNNRSSPGLIVTVMENEKKVKLWIRSDFILSWKDGEITDRETLKQNTNRRTNSGSTKNSQTPSQGTEVTADDDTSTSSTMNDQVMDN